MDAFLAERGGVILNDNDDDKGDKSNDEDKDKMARYGMMVQYGAMAGYGTMA